MTGLLLMSLAMLPIGFTHSLTLLFTLISLFYLGTITAEPARETLSASLADPHARGSYMGFSRLGHALGGAIGFIGGGWLYDIGHWWGVPALPWHLLTIIGLLSLWALHQQFHQQKKTIIYNDK
ncbi:MFS transporter [Arsenophonus endosymbiont of Aphis craccivora]|uniref:MFS transporter n=1 Tax=Arsenophonus endosymbiont of Aphis craccivora TaxID=1231049 RepID=UPI0034E27EBF